MLALDLKKKYISLHITDNLKIIMQNKHPTLVFKIFLFFEFLFQFYKDFLPDVEAAESGDGIVLHGV